MEECVLMAGCVERYKDTPYEEKLKNTMLYWNELLNVTRRSKKFLKESKSRCLLILEKLKEEGLIEFAYAIILLSVYTYIKTPVEHTEKGAIKAYQSLINALEELIKIKKTTPV